MMSHSTRLLRQGWSAYTERPVIIGKRKHVQERTGNRFINGNHVYLQKGKEYETNIWGVTRDYFPGNPNVKNPRPGIFDASYVHSFRMSVEESTGTWSTRMTTTRKIQVYISNSGKEVEVLKSFIGSMSKGMRKRLFKIVWIWESAKVDKKMTAEEKRLAFEQLVKRCFSKLCKRFGLELSTWNTSYRFDGIDIEPNREEKRNRRINKILRR